MGLINILKFKLTSWLYILSVLNGLKRVKVEEKFEALSIYKQWH
jgi:hypothetical protein